MTDLLLQLATCKARSAFWVVITGASLVGTFGEADPVKVAVAVATLGVSAAPPPMELSEQANPVSITRMRKMNVTRRLFVVINGSFL
jgi:hypothetical protein